MGINAKLRRDINSPDFSTWNCLFSWYGLL